jgi:DNA polymerase III alpha subunit (gram-positive type)
MARQRVIIVAITSHFFKFQAQAAIKTLISSPTCPLSRFLESHEDLLAQENIHRGDYIQALKQADNGDYELLIKLQGNLVGG